MPHTTARSAKRTHVTITMEWSNGKLVTLPPVTLLIHRNEGNVNLAITH